MVFKKRVCVMIAQLRQELSSHCLIKHEVIQNSDEYTFLSRYTAYSLRCFSCLHPFTIVYFVTFQQKNQVTLSHTLWFLILTRTHKFTHLPGVTHYNPSDRCLLSVPFLCAKSACTVMSHPSNSSFSIVTNQRESQCYMWHAETVKCQ